MEVMAAHHYDLIFVLPLFEVWWENYESNSSDLGCYTSSEGLIT